MSWPSPQDYNESIQNPRQAFVDAELQEGHPELNLLGLPRPITGAFASVYKMQCGQRTWAVRCFLRDFTDQQQRYTAINQHLDRVRLPYTVGFTFLSQGIRVRGQWHPILKMEWVQGDPLNVYIEKHLGHADVLLALASRWIRMIKELQQASIAHGDLQHGNILVVGGELRLVDYDAMYVPALTGKTSHEAGHRNYQHPSRTDDFGLYLDNFSAWVIYLSLIAFSIKPGLWHHFGAGDECLLFRRGDFTNPGSSLIFLTLERSQNSQIQQLASLFRSQLHLPLSKFPPFDEVHIPNLTNAEAGPGEQTGWLSDYVTFDLSKESAAETVEQKNSRPGDSWIRDHVQHSEVKPVAFDFVTISDRLAFLTFIGALLLFGSYSLIVEPISIFWSCTVVMIVSGIVGYRYRMQDAVQTKRHLRGEIGLAQKKMKVLDRAIDAIEREKRSVDNAEKTKLLDLEKHNQKMLAKESREIREADEKLKKILVQLNSRRSLLKQEEAEAIRKVRVQLQARIADLPRQRTAIDQAKSFDLNKLYNSLELRHANIQDIGPKLTRRLLKAGITKASDVTHPRVSAIEGFGDVKTAAVLEWRKWVEAHVQSEEVRIRAKYGSQRRTLEAQESAAKQQARSEEEAIRRKYIPMVDVLDKEDQKARNETKGIVDGIRRSCHAEHNALDHAIEGAQKQAELQRKAIDSNLERERKSISEMGLDLEKIQRQLSRYNQITFGTYLRRVFLV
jgi:hypothetical protein